MKAYDRIVDFLTGALGWVGIVTVFLMLIHITLDVVLRFTLNMPVWGTITMVSLYYMPIIVFAPLALAEKEDGHIAMEIIHAALRDGLRNIVSLIGTVISIVVVAAMTYATFLEFHSKYRIGSAIMEHSTRVPTWITYAIVPLGLGVMGLVLIGKLVRSAHAGQNR